MHDGRGASTTAPAQVSAAAVPLRRPSTRPTRRPRRREQLAAWITVAGQPVLRQELRQPPLGLPVRRRHHRADRRHPRRQPADQPGAARLPDRGVHQERLRRPARDAADLQVADVSAVGRDEQVERGRQDQLLARPRPPPAGRGAATTRSTASPGRRRRFPGVPPGTRAAALPDSGVELPSGFLATFGRPARESACECERTSGLQLGPVMALVSGPTHRPTPSPTRPTTSPSSSAAGDGRRQARQRALPAHPEPAGDRRRRSRPASRPCADDRGRPRQAGRGPGSSARPRSPPIAAQARSTSAQAAIAKAKAELAAYEKELAPQRRRGGEAAATTASPQAEADLKEYEDDAGAASWPSGRRRRPAAVDWVAARARRR